MTLLENVSWGFQMLLCPPLLLARCPLPRSYLTSATCLTHVGAHYQQHQFSIWNCGTRAQRQRNRPTDAKPAFVMFCWTYWRSPLGQTHGVLRAWGRWTETFCSPWDFLSVLHDSCLEWEWEALLCPAHESLHFFSVSLSIPVTRQTFQALVAPVGAGGHTQFLFAFLAGLWEGQWVNAETELPSLMAVTASFCWSSASRA